MFRMSKTKLIALGLAVLGALTAAAVQTGVGADVVRAVCPPTITVFTPAAVQPAAPDAGVAH